MAVITREIVSHHANWMLTTIDNADQAPVSVCGQGRVEMDGLTATIYLADGDCVYSLTLKPVTETAVDGVGVVVDPPGSRARALAEILARSSAITRGEAQRALDYVQVYGARRLIDTRYDVGVTYDEESGFRVYNLLVAADSEAYSARFA